MKTSSFARLAALAAAGAATVAAAARSAFSFSEGPPVGLCTAGSPTAMPPGRHVGRGPGTRAAKRGALKARNQHRNRLAHRGRAKRGARA